MLRCRGLWLSSARFFFQPFNSDLAMVPSTDLTPIGRCVASMTLYDIDGNRYLDELEFDQAFRHVGGCETAPATSSLYDELVLTCTEYDADWLCRGRGIALLGIYPASYTNVVCNVIYAEATRSCSDDTLRPSMSPTTRQADTSGVSLMPSSSPTPQSSNEEPVVDSFNQWLAGVVAAIGISFVLAFVLLLLQQRWKARKLRARQRRERSYSPPPGTTVFSPQLVCGGRVVDNFGSFSLHSNSIESHPFLDADDGSTSFA